ncbi:MAG: glycoside hydrolase family 3 protein [Clostridia bacterium]|nr:glycoside hydrolase family 3 protein [Clostridia bacterium]
MQYEISHYKNYDLGNLKREPVVELEEYSLKAAKEGIVLLENKNNMLPLKKGDRVSVFGRIQREYYKSGTGSGGLVNVKYVTNIADELKAIGTVELNKELESVYEEWIKDNPYDTGTGAWASEPWCQEEMELSCEVVENARRFGDKAIIVIGRTAGEDKDNSATEGSYLLSAKEEDMIKKVAGVFENVCVILNVGSVIDMSWVEKYSVSSVMYVWQGGMCGGKACAEVLCGLESPSGKLADTIAKSIEDYPSTANFGGPVTNLYKEDIYVGYRYFETFAKDKVAYPFGYGLSYTKFEINATGSVKNDKIILSATVKNVGEYEGKEVVQVYYGAPQGKLGKSLRSLGAYAKTPSLKPGEECTLTLELPISQMASYDDSGATGYKSCYVLEAGDYPIYVGADVRNARESFVYNVKDTAVTEKCTEALSPVIPFERIKPDENMNISYESVPTCTYSYRERVESSIPEEIPYTGDKGIKLEDVRNGKNTMDEFVAQLSDSDLASLVLGEGMNSPKVTPGTGSCFGGVTEELISFGIPIVCTTDGPSGIRMDSGLLATSMPNGTCLACTFNRELVSELYSLEGVEMTAYEIDVILGPGINIHRNPLNGRNFEYFSEDPYLAGSMAASISVGLGKVGVYCTAKHYMANSQEWKRHSSDSVMSERAAREIYARPFEIAVKDGGCKSIMTAYNIVNSHHAASNFDMTKTILRDEWKYEGFVMTDWWAWITDYEGNRNMKDVASMVKSVNDVYMVVPNAKTYDHNIMESLESGYLKRAELQRCAKNLCNFVMYTHAYERFRANGFTYEIVNMDTSGLTSAYSIENVELGKAFTIPVEKSGRYIIELEIVSALSPLAQIAIIGELKGTGDCTFVTHGTDGEVGVTKSAISLMKGNAEMTLTSKDTGLKIKKVSFLI